MSKVERKRIRIVSGGDVHNTVVYDADGNPLKGVQEISFVMNVHVREPLAKVLILNPEIDIAVDADVETVGRSEWAEHNFPRPDRGAISCEHANEMPRGECSCPCDCYCRREGSCPGYAFRA